jgi:hypothetical protein
VPAEAVRAPADENNLVVSAWLTLRADTADDPDVVTLKE